MHLLKFLGVTACDIHLREKAKHLAGLIRHREVEAHYLRRG